MKRRRYLELHFFRVQEFFGKTKFDRCSTDLAPRIDGTGRREDHLYNMQKNLEYRSRQMDKNKQETRKKAKKRKSKLGTDQKNLIASERMGTNGI